MRHRDDLPFEALRGVDGEDLHAVGVDLHLTGCESLLDLLRRREVGQQTGKRRVGASRVGRDDGGEGVEMLAAGDTAPDATRASVSMPIPSTRSTSATSSVSG